MLMVSSLLGTLNNSLSLWLSVTVFLAVSKTAMSADLRSPIPSEALTPSAPLPPALSQASSVVEPSQEFNGPVPKPGITQVYLLHLLSLEGQWWTRYKLPDNAVSAKRHGNSIVNTNT